MKKFSIADLARIIKAHPSPVPSDEQQATSDEFFTGVSIDSRTTKAGDCFFAINGENFDGHDFVCDAFTKGAICAVVSKNITCEIENRKSKIENSLRAPFPEALCYGHPPPCAEGFGGHLQPWGQLPALVFVDLHHAQDLLHHLPVIA